MTLVLRNSTLIDGTGQKPIQGATVVVEKGLIAALSHGGEGLPPIPPTAQLMDCSGKTIIPGLIDSHVHLAFTALGDSPSIISRLVSTGDGALALQELCNAQECLLAGITTVRDCGDRHNTTLAVRQAIEEGLLIGPRILASGMPLTTTFGHLHFCGLEVEGVDDLGIAVRQQAKCHVGWIKVAATGGMMTGNAKPRLPQYGQPELDAICEEARRLDKPVAAHVLSAEGIRRCVRAGVHTLEHCLWPNPDGSSGYDPHLADEMAAKAIAVGNTVTGPSRAHLLPGYSGSDADRDRALEALYHSAQPMRAMREAGVEVMISSHAGVVMTPLGGFWPSLKLASLQMEMSPVETLRAATQIPAEVLGLGGRLGTVEVGKEADLDVLDADPLADLENVRSVRAVVKGGRIVVRDGRLESPLNRGPE